MKEKLAKLVDVKSIMTLLLTVVFCVLALTGVISGTEFLTIFTVVVGFYFGTQSEKNATKKTVTAGPDETVAVIGDTQSTGTEVHPEAAADTQKPPSEITVTGFGR